MTSVSYSAGHHPPHLAVSRLILLAEKEEHQGAAAVFSPPDSAVKTRNPGGMEEGTGDVQWKESFTVKVIPGFRCLKVCLIEEIQLALELVLQQISIPYIKYISYSPHCLNMGWATQDWRCVNGDWTIFRHNYVEIHSASRHNVASENRNEGRGEENHEDGKGSAGEACGRG